MPTSVSAALHALAVTLALLVAGQAYAHDGHDHEAPPPPVPNTIAPRGEAVSEAFELVAIPRDGTLRLYLDQFRTGTPITDATLEVDTPDGPKAAAPTADRSYQLPAPWLSKPGHYDVVVTVTAGSDVDVLLVSLTIPEPAAAAATPVGPLQIINATVQGAMPVVTAGLKDRLSRQDPALIGVAVVSFLLGLLVMLALRSKRRRVPAFALLAITATLLLSAKAFAQGDEDHGATPTPAALARPSAGSTDLAQRLPNGAVFVPKPTQRLLELRTTMTKTGAFQRTIGLPGRVIPNPNASGVVQSSVGGRLSPPASGLFPRLGTPVKKGDVLAYVTPPVQRVDVSDMRQRQGELDQQIATVERRVERFTKLAQTGAVAQVQLDEARDQLQGLHDRRSALDEIRFDPEPLIAPVNGVVAEASATAGQMANAGQMIFQVVNPANLWIEALSFDALTAGQHATARLPDGRTFDLTYQGSGLADRNQAIPVQFAIEGDASGLRVGQFLTVLANTEGQLSGLALPRAAVVRTGNGQDVVYEHTSAERYEARQVRIEPLDGNRVLIGGGIGPGKRVVVQGAELLDQVR